jgi:hypothetical protein
MALRIPFGRTRLRQRLVVRLLHRRNASPREASRSVGERPAFHPVAAGVFPLRAWQRLSDDRRAARVARYEEVVHRRALGESMKAIARAIDIDLRTVRSAPGQWHPAGDAGLLAIDGLIAGSDRRRETAA